MLDGNHWRTAQLVDTLQASANLEQDLKIISMLGLKPEKIKVKNLYNETPADKNNDFKIIYNFKWGDLEGSGDTVYKAVMDFNNSYYNNNKTESPK